MTRLYTRMPSRTWHPGRQKTIQIIFSCSIHSLEGLRSESGIIKGKNTGLGKPGRRKLSCSTLKKKKKKSSGSSINLAMYNAAHDGLRAYKKFLCGFTLTYTTWIMMAWIVRVFLRTLDDNLVLANKEYTVRREKKKMQKCVTTAIAKKT